MHAIRAAEPSDIPDLLRLVHELAVYEREPDAVEATPELFATALFPADGAPVAHAYVAEVEGNIVGMALWYVTFSTWVGRPGMWLEDLYISPEHRGAGLGKALLQRLARVCVERGYGRLEWWVLDWNEPSIGFYRSLGAVAQDEWTTFRLDGPGLATLGSAHHDEVANSSADPASESERSETERTESERAEFWRDYAAAAEAVASSEPMAAEEAAENRLWERTTRDGTTPAPPG